MLVTWKQKQCILLLLALLVVVSESSRLPNWEQMLPKKLPKPTSAPSRGTNSVTVSSSSTDRYLPSSDGKV
ncbi:hypothetical protein LINGRAPRIM_LOCUS2501 [Linum grandiflorum]